MLATPLEAPCAWQTGRKPSLFFVLYEEIRNKKIRSTTIVQQTHLTKLITFCATFTPDLSTNVVLSILLRAFMTSCCSISKSSYFSPNMMAIKDKYVCEDYGTIDR